MKKQFCCDVVFALICFCVFPYVFAEEDQERLRENFLREAPKAWKELREYYAKGMDAEIEMTSDEDPPEKVHIIINDLYEYNHWIEPNGDESISVINPKYAFSIEKESENTLWTLEGLDTPNSARIDPQFTNGLLSASVMAFGGLFIEYGWVDELVSSDTFNIVSIQEKDAEGESGHITKGIEVQFQSDHNLDNSNRVIGGKMTFAPDKHWLLTDYDIEVFFPLGVKNKNCRGIRKYQYQKINDHYYPSTIDTTYIHPNRPEIKEHSVITYTTNTQPKDDLFYLKHYGLSEPDLPKPIGHTTRYTVLFLGILLIAVGIYLRRRASQA